MACGIPDKITYCNGRPIQVYIVNVVTVLVGHLYQNLLVSCNPNCYLGQKKHSELSKNTGKYGRALMLNRKKSR